MSGSASAGSEKSSGSSSGTERGSFTGDQTGRTTNIAPEGWEDAYNEARIKLPGYTDDQQTAVDFVKSSIGSDAGGQERGRQYFQEQTGRDSMTLQGLAEKYPDQYGKQPSLGEFQGLAKNQGLGQYGGLGQYQGLGDYQGLGQAQGVGSFQGLGQDPTIQSGTIGRAADVGDRQGSSFMRDYSNPYERDVVQGALGDMRQQYDENINTQNMQQSAAGAFGGGRHALRDAATTNEYLKNAGNLSAQVRGQGFNTAASLGQADASRNLQGQGMNQRAAQQTNLAQAGQDFSASSANANLINNRQQYGAGMQNQRDMYNAQTQNQRDLYNAQTQNQRDIYGDQALTKRDMFDVSNLNTRDMYDNRTQNQRDMFDASRGDSRDRYTADMLNQRQMFDVGAAERGQQGRDSAALNEARMARGQFGTDQGLASTLFGAGGQGQRQVLDWLDAGGKLFDQTTENTATGSNVGSTTGQQQAKGSSKGGGVKGTYK